MNSLRDSVFLIWFRLVWVRNFSEVMMRVQVKLFASLTRFAGNVKSGAPFEVDLPDSATLANLCQVLRLPADEVKVTFVNGRAQDENWLLQPGDEVGIFPPIGGG
jgi:sulfur-carrier protein